MGSLSDEFLIQGVQKTADSEWAIILAASEKFN